jgi:hypothetical protein
MSRRIALWLLAASAALSATPAFADRECFDQSCRLMPAVVEPPPPAPAAPQALPNVPPETAAQAADARAEAPARARPRMVVDPAPRELPPPPRYDEGAKPQPLRPAAPQAAPRETVVERRPPVQVIQRAPSASYGFLPAGAESGYRAPFGYRIAPGYVIAPDARIITIETNE